MQLDDYGDPLEERVTGSTLIPDEAQDWLTCYPLCMTWQLTPYQFDELDAHEWLRRVALYKASTWNEPTAEQMMKNKIKKYRGL